MTAHQPDDSSAERSEVTSASPDATMPPTTATGSMLRAARVNVSTALGAYDGRNETDEILTL
jgi:hypothetical protein